VVAGGPVRALEIKLSQGAKPSLGGLLPAAKVSAEIAAARGIPEGRDCVSPSRHAEFSDTDSLLDWVELLASETGLPVGIKSAVGDLDFWYELTDRMRETGRGVDFVTYGYKAGMGLPSAADREVRGRTVKLVPTWSGVFDESMAGSVLLPGENARIAPTTFDDWLVADAR